MPLVVKKGGRSPGLTSLTTGSSWLTCTIFVVQLCVVACKMRERVQISTLEHRFMPTLSTVEHRFKTDQISIVHSIKDGDGTLTYNFQRTKTSIVKFVQKRSKFFKKYGNMEVKKYGSEYQRMYC